MLEKMINSNTIAEIIICVEDIAKNMVIIIEYDFSTNIKISM